LLPLLLPLMTGLERAKEICVCEGENENEINKLIIDENSKQQHRREGGERNNLIYYRAQYD
jgi:hypothetical protein